MKSINLKNSASAIKHGKFFRITMLSGILFLVLSCTGNAQKSQALVQIPANKITLQDTLNKPKINFRVNKQYDKNGNIVKYDSTYSYVYSSKNNGSKLLNDSIFNDFQKYFNNGFDDIFKNENGFFNSSFKFDLFNNNFINKSFNLNNEFYKDLDSIKQNIYKNKEPVVTNEKKI